MSEDRPIILNFHLFNLKFCTSDVIVDEYDSVEICERIVDFCLGIRRNRFAPNGRFPLPIAALNVPKSFYVFLVTSKFYKLRDLVSIISNIKMIRRKRSILILNTRYLFSIFKA